MKPRPFADDDFLCSRCGYVLNGLSRGSVCPECGLLIETSHPDARRGTPWQRGERFGYFKTLLMALVQPRRMFEVVRIDANSVVVLKWVHFSIAALVVCTAALISFHPDPKFDPPGLAAFVVVWLMPLAWLGLAAATAVERRGIMLWGRARGRRISAGVASTIVAHASAGWVAGSLLVGASFYAGFAMRHLAQTWPPATYELLLLGPLIMPLVGALLGLLWFEILVYLGVRRCQYANMPAAAARLVAVDDRTRGDASLH
ncbi:MAG: hypothetical protein KF757_08265 [Phycisphaeraceae bacterium]|nr:hypothetical protein [Phycisphaeraceae bacterium]MCW5762750.1 hypothetical protein [Phycisphaeraceae bacterium]